MPSRLGMALAAVALWATSAAALEVTGNWSLSGAGLSQISAASFIQTGSTLTLCRPGRGTVAAGTIDEGSGAFALSFVPDFADPLYEFGVCSLEWSGSFALDGASLSGSETYSLGCTVPFPCCLAPQSDPIGGSRVSTTVSCCGNGVLEGAEACDVAASGSDCCANDCTFEPAGHSCRGTDQCNLRECDGFGACLPAPPVDCGACYRCDPVAGCRADLRADCRTAGSRSRLRLVGQGTATKFRWQWREGTDAETTLADFGDPGADTDYELCVFTTDLVASGFARLQAAPAAGAACGQQSCWKDTSRGFRYRDPAGGADGVRRLVLTANSARRSTLKATGVGTNLSPPLASAVTVQLSARDAAPARCWSATFGAPQVNQPGRYQATLP